MTNITDGATPTEGIPLPNGQNKATQLTQEQQWQIAQDYGARRWAHVRQQKIARLVEDSQEAWDHLLSNTPDLAVLSRRTGGVLTPAQMKDIQTKSLRMGKIPEIVFTLLAMQHESTFPSGDRFFELTPNNDVAKQHKELMAQFLMDNLTQSRFDFACWLHRLNTIVDGTAACAVHYRRRSRRKTIYERPVLTLGPLKFGLPITEAKTRQVVEWEGTTLEPLNFNDWIVDPDAASLEESYFIRRWYAPTHDVAREFHLPIDEVLPHEHAAETWQRNPIAEHSGIATAFTASMQEPEGKSKALLMGIYDDFLVEGTLYKNHVAIILNDSRVIYFAENEYNHGRKPYLISQYYALPGQLYGLSAVKHVLPAAAVRDKLIYATAKTAHLAANPMMLIDHTELAFMGNTQPEWGAKIPVKNPNGAIQVLQVPAQNLPVVANLIATTEHFMESSTGVNPIIAGQPLAEGGQPTAFHVNQMAQAGGIKFRPLLRQFNALILEPFLSMAYENFQQYFSGEQPVGGFDKSVSRQLFRLSSFGFLLTAAAALQARNQQLANFQLLLQLIPDAMKLGWLKLKGGQTEVDIHALFRQLLLTGQVPNVSDLIQYTQPEQDSMPLATAPSDLSTALPQVDIRQSESFMGEKNA